MLAKISAAQKWLLELELSSSLEAVLLGPHCHTQHGTVFASLPRGNQNTPGGIKTPKTHHCLPGTAAEGTHPVTTMHRAGIHGGQQQTKAQSLSSPQQKATETFFERNLYESAMQLLLGTLWKC